MTSTELRLSIYDLGLPEALTFVARAVGQEAAQAISRQAGTGLFVLFARDERFSMHRSDDEAVIEVLEAGLVEVAATPGRLLKLSWKVGPLLDAKFKAVICAHNRRHTVGRVSLELH